MPYLPPFPSRPELLTMAMMELAAERGVHDMSIRSLASAIRTAPGSLTYHYRSKDEMFATCARFLGYWLYRDLGDRLADGGLAGLLPDPAADAGWDDLEYARRWRVWMQLSAYALSSPAVAGPVQALEQQMMGVLDDICVAGSGSEGTRRVWSTLTSLVVAVLRPGAAMSREEAVATLTLALAAACACSCACATTP